MDFDMIAWDEGKPGAFDHRRSGWPLDGKHATLECRQCHQPRFQVSEAARLGPGGAEGGHKWVGLDVACSSCHEREDVHRGALGANCAQCHDASHWKPVANFDHAKTSYPLTGRHAPVACAKCHEAARLKLPLDASGRIVPLYKPLPHQECSDCHEDAHQGRLGPACARCHSTDDFRKTAPNTFDHDRTRYPLRGAHGTIACARCHDPKTAWGSKPLFGRCGDCHKDAHAGKATVGGNEADCSACHSLDTFKTSTFGLERHAASDYPLLGAHRRLACDACHPKSAQGTSSLVLGTSGVLIRRAHARCSDCHADAHGGQLASRQDHGACEPCHRVDGWKPSLFGVVEHKSLKLPLEGRHAEIACIACHGNARKGLPPLPGGLQAGSAKVALRIAEIGCAECHLDPHRGRFKASSTGANSPCLDCHDTRSFRPSHVSVETHQAFSYKLEGAHVAVPCQACHAELAPPPGPPRTEPASSLVLPVREGRALEFARKRSACADCHKNPHGDQFARRKDGGACQSCHGLDAFKPASRFDHVKDAAFQLDGAHAHVPCNKCHVARPQASDPPLVVYSPTPARCQDCHVGQSSGAKRS
jgi:hypothetical protein